MFIAAFVVAEFNTWLQVIITGMSARRRKKLDPSSGRESLPREGLVSNALQASQSLLLGLHMIACTHDEIADQLASDVVPIKCSLQFPVIYRLPDVGP
jgi:hypothetical protein